MSGDNFYLTLLSNSSFSVFPENKASAFTVDLPKTINLEGEWEVCLTDILYQQTIENVTKDNNQFKITFTARYELIRFTKVYSIQIGFYSTLEEIIDALNSVIIDDTPGVKHWENASNRLFALHPQRLKIIIDQELLNELIIQLQTELIYFEDDGDGFSKSMFEGLTAQPKETNEQYIFEKASLTGCLALQLGYEPGSCLRVAASHHIPSIGYGIDPQFLVYLDVIEPQIFSDIHGEVIKVVPAIERGNSFGDLCVRNFSVRTYVPVVTKCFKTISIDIRSSTSGKPIPFSFGNTVCVLHMRRTQRK